MLKYKVLLAVSAKDDYMDFEIWKSLSGLLPSVSKHCAVSVSIVFQVLIADFITHSAVMSPEFILYKTVLHFALCSFYKCILSIL
jgi:hypothetical protein